MYRSGDFGSCSYCHKTKIESEFVKSYSNTGISKALRQKGIKEGDTVIFGELELEWSDDQSDGAIYERWLDDVKAQGIALRGSARWPHAGG